MRERVLLFGPEKSLVGVITDPDDLARARERPAVVLLNAGILHRVGPNRLYVTLARRLAAAGSVVARFDHSGIGDSQVAAERGEFAGRAVAEVRDCMDVLAATRGIRGFVLAGLCSGADNALRVASEDERVVGAALIELNSLPSAGHFVHSYRERLWQPGSWLRLLTGRSEAWSTLREMLTSRRGETESRPDVASHAPAVVAQATCALARGARLLLIYSAGNPALYNYRTLLERRLGEPALAGRARVAVLEGTDHAFTPLAAQARVLSLVAEWLGSVAAAPARAPAEAARAG